MGGNSFIHRAGLILDTLLEELPDIVCFHKFGRQDPFTKLDYILTSSATAALAQGAKAWEHCVNGIYLSDHYPIELIINL